MQNDDAVRRLIVEARNKAEGLFYSSDKAMAEFGTLLPPDEFEFLTTELAECRAAIAMEELQTVEDAVARLEVAAQRIGEAIYAAADGGGSDIGGGM
jgi:molecular chaperone DnaK